MSSVEFAWKPPAAPARVSGESVARTLSLSDRVLERNVLWYVRLRWIALASLAALQAFLGAGEQHLARFGLTPPGPWLFVIGGLLFVANVLYLAAFRNPSIHRRVPPIVQLWAQILVDLLCLTVFVHVVGSLATPASYLYVLHIALACIFFSNRASFRVALLAAGLYTACLALEYIGPLAPRSLMSTTARGPALTPPLVVLHAGATIGMMLVVWYVVARLSRIVRLHERELIRTQEETRQAWEERDQNLSQMTHQLKAPLDAIRSNVALLTGGYCGALPDAAREILPKIENRARAMGDMILDVLRLANLRAGRGITAGTPRRVAISDQLRRCVDELATMAAGRHVTLQADIAPAEVAGVPEQLAMLFTNLLTNAIIYSHDGGTVRVRCRPDGATGAPVVTIADQGIGISPEQLPHIFEKYFRTREAVRYNEASTGLGLAIVQHIAQSHGLRVKVDSELGKGTTFAVWFPPALPAESAGSAD